MKTLIKRLDRNIDSMISLSLCYLLQLGMKYGLFNTPEMNALLNRGGEHNLGNKDYVKKLIDTYINLGIFEELDGKTTLKGVSYEFRITPEDSKEVAYEWIEVLEELYRMAGYAFISREHPRILMDFDKGADFWDMRLLLEPYRTARRVIAEVLGLEDGIRVLDLGCGSVSPVELGRYVGPNGKYVGVDFSPGLLSIAETRIRNEGMDWVILREMDVRKILPRNTYDAIILSQVLEYTENPGALVRRALDMLEVEGKLLILDPFRDTHPLVPALEFFESLTPEFVKFPTTSNIFNALDETPYDVSFDLIGKSIILITRLE